MSKSDIVIPMVDVVVSTELPAKPQIEEALASMPPMEVGETRVYEETGYRLEVTRDGDQITGSETYSEDALRFLKGMR